MSDSGKAVFLSYASQDAEAAKRICDALRAAGVEVWFDQSELVGGDAWDQKIRKQIKECALFVPIISASTQVRREGYFRLEWKLAEDRTHLMAKGTPFLLPVCIDETKDWDAIVPDSFMTVQWTRLRPAGYAGHALDDSSLAAFGERVRKLLAGEAPRQAEGAGRRIEAGGIGKVVTPNKHEPRVVRSMALAAVVMAAVGIAIFVFRHASTPEPSASPSAAVAAAKPLSEAGRLVAQARTIVEHIGYTRDDLALADDLCRRATELEPTLADAWAARAYVGGTYMNRGWDRSEGRARDIQAFASRALALDANAVEALMAQGIQLAIRQAPMAEVEPFFRRAIAVAPTDVRPLRWLGYYFSLDGQNEAAATTLAAAVRVDPRDVLTHYNLSTHYAARGELAIALQHAEATLALSPNFSSALMLKAALAVRQNGDLVAMRTALDRLPAAERSGDRAVYFLMWAGLLERNLSRVLAASAMGTSDYLTDNLFRGPKAWLLALAYEEAGQAASARLQWQAAETVLRRRTAAGSTSHLLDQWQLAYTLAWLGELDEAARIVAPLETAAREQPNPANQIQLARYYAARADAVAAVPYLRYMLTHFTNGGYGGFTAHVLRLEPDWDRLRGQPAFEALLQEFTETAKTPGDGAQWRDKSSSTK